MGAKMTSEYVTEPIGFKVMFGGGVFATLGDWIAGINWASVIGVTVMVCGFAIQVAAAKRGQAAEKRAKEAEKREIEKHIAEMAILDHKKKMLASNEQIET